MITIIAAVSSSAMTMNSAWWRSASVSPVDPSDLPAATRNRTLRLSIQRQPAKPTDRLRVPLSYREQWLGSQECFRAYAL